MATMDWSPRPDRIAAGNYSAEATDDGEAGQRDDERRNALIGDEITLQRTERRPQP